MPHTTYNLSAYVTKRLSDPHVYQKLMEKLGHLFYRTIKSRKVYETAKPEQDMAILRSGGFDNDPSVFFEALGLYGNTLLELFPLFKEHPERFSILQSYLLGVGVFTLQYDSFVAYLRKNDKAWAVYLEEHRKEYYDYFMDRVAVINSLASIRAKTLWYAETNIYPIKIMEGVSTQFGFAYLNLADTQRGLVYDGYGDRGLMFPYLFSDSFEKALVTHH